MQTPSQVMCYSLLNIEHVGVSNIGIIYPIVKESEDKADVCYSSYISIWHVSTYGSLRKPTNSSERTHTSLDNIKSTCI